MKRILLFVVATMVAITTLAQDYKYSAGVVTGSFNALSYKMFVADNLAIQADLGFSAIATSGSGSFYYYWREEMGAATGIKCDAKLNASLWTFQLSPNVVYHLKVSEQDWCRISAVLGGGISFGYAKFNKNPEVVSDKMTYNAYPTSGQDETIVHEDMSVLEDEDKEVKYSRFLHEGFQEVGVQNSDYGKFGINAMLGIEVALKNVPITFGVDFRPGYGLMFTGHSSEYSELKEEWTADGGEGDYKETPFTFNFFDWTLSTSIRYTF